MAKNTIVLNWQDNSSDEDGFKIYKSTDGVTFNYLATVGVGVITYTAQNILDGQEYWFGVSSYNGNGESSQVQNGPISCSWPNLAPASAGAGSGIKNAVTIVNYNNMNSYNGGL